MRDESYEEKNNDDNDCVRKILLVEEIELCLAKAKIELKGIVSARLLHCIESEPDRYLMETR